jgi:signal transduction histidine kinase
MQNVGGAVRLVLVTLSLTELAVVLLRLRHRSARQEASWVATVLAVFAVRLLIPRESIADVLAPSVVLAATGNLLLLLNGRKGKVLWTCIVAGLAVVLSSLDVLLVGDDTTTRLLRAVPLALLAIPPLALLVLLWRKTGEVADLLLLALAAAWAAAVSAETASLLPARASDWMLAPLLIIVGYVLFEEGYLSPLTTSGYVDRLAAQRRRSRETYARLLASEDALAVQDRLITAGLLAIGAAHEFKNVLASLRLVAEHGLARPDVAAKDRDLTLVLEHAEAGAVSATAFLERLGMEGRAEPQSFRVADLLDRCARFARPALRSAGILMTLSCEQDLSAVVRRPEIEQILLNLLRNAADVFVARGCGEPRLLRIEAKAGEESADISVCDNAGGIDPGEEGVLFSLGWSTRGSTGIGLYLARTLAERNGGTLSFSRVDGGSIFLLRLPRCPG